MLGGAAVLFGRADLLVLATPLLLVALGGRLGAPHRISEAASPTVRNGLAPSRVREGESTQWVTVIEPVHGVEHLAVALDHDPWMELTEAVHGIGRSPEDGSGGELEVRTPARPLRWGPRRVGPAAVALTSAWGAYRMLPVERPSRTLTVLPLPATFDSSAPPPHPNGLVGPDRGRRVSSGTEFFGIRPFQAGDRLRRVHWPVSLRTGALQVVTTYADQDSEVALVVDAFSDLDPAGDGANGSLAVSVRAASAMAEHHLRRGDRVSLTVVGGAQPLRVPGRSGGRQLVRVLEALATVEPPTRPIRIDPTRALRDVRAGAVAVIVSPLLRPEMATVLLTLAGRGITTLAVDTLPPQGVPPLDEVPMSSRRTDPWGPLAWRLRLLERDSTVCQLLVAGVPVVPWRGPGSLDQVLRGLGARAGRARVARR